MNFLDATLVSARSLLTPLLLRASSGAKPPRVMAKSAARMVKKERVEYDDHCPHCDHKFHEKGYPRPDFSKLPEDEEERNRMIMDGEVDDVCPNCKGVVDSAEASDEDIENTRKGMFGDAAADHMLRRRENQRKRIAARESDMAKTAALTSAIRRARNATHTDPTPAQAAAGNYAKGEATLHGMTVKLENPKGSMRRGYKDDGSVAWESSMSADYGYFKNTKAVDGDAIDCFIGPNPDSELVIAIDQYRGEEFDETKFVLGVDSQEEGEKLYLAHYPKGWRLGPVSTCTVQQLKSWLAKGGHKEPFKGQMIKTAGAVLWRAALDLHRSSRYNW